MAGSPTFPNHYQSKPADSDFVMFRAALPAPTAFMGRLNKHPTNTAQRATSLAGTAMIHHFYSTENFTANQRSWIQPNSSLFDGTSVTLCWHSLPSRPTTKIRISSKYFQGPFLELDSFRLRPVMQPVETTPFLPFHQTWHLRRHGFDAFAIA